MDNPKFLAMVSPKGGQFRPAVCRHLELEFNRAGLELVFHYIESDSGLRAAIDQSLIDGCNLFLAIGGDGTVSRVAGCLHGKPHTLGIIPVGTANTLARMLGISMNLEKAAKTAAAMKKTRSVDGMKVGDRLCLLNVSAGVSSLSLDGLDAAQKAATGMLAYVIGAAKATLKIAPCDYEITLDGHTFNTRAVEIHVTNIGAIGVPQYHLYEKSHIDDGNVEVLVISRWTPQKIVDTVLDLVLRRRKRAIRFIGGGSAIAINCTQVMPVQGDGDIIGVTPVSITVLPQAVNFIVG
ncbi:MAG: hypothetical protein E4H31_00475 [Dehalococcoidia bacterium]|nr:MAG: hypothetical protein E4H31_00475 [Dehalococcoidia bacterium]